MRALGPPGISKLALNVRQFFCCVLYAYLSHKLLERAFSVPAIS